MQPLATDVTRSVVRVGHIDVLCKNGRTDRDAVWGMTHVGARIHVLDGGQDRTNPFTAAMGDKSAMRSFAKLPWTLVGIFFTDH